MKNLNTMLLCDFYKLSHREMYPQGTEFVYSTWTPRDSRLENVTKVVAFGFQAFVQTYLVDFFNENFFSKPKLEVVNEYSRLVKNTLGVLKPETKHIEELHDLGFLPLLIKALPEGTLTPLRIPMATVQNTDPRFFWLTNYIETLASCSLWQMSTSATLAHEYRKILDKAAFDTVGNNEFVAFQGHDFSMRGMSSLESAVTSGMGHLLSFSGTDTIPSIQALEHYYGANVETELVGTSIPATEHSIQCAYGNDEEYLKKMITEVHPSGFVSVVSDGYDFWDVLGRVVPSLKTEIMKRDGRVVIRPDSGDPVKIVCGNPDAPVGSLEHKGAIEVLWDTFGGTFTEKGYKLLDSHIGLIYGDSITLARAKEITDKLKEKGFASINCVFGIGSYTYNYNTRDTFGFALKSTFCVINGEEKAISKNPKTDSGIKKSAKGLIRVNDDLTLSEQVSWSEECSGLLQPIFLNGVVYNKQSLGQIRNRLSTQNKV